MAINNNQNNGREIAELSKKIQDLKVRIHNIHAAIGKEYYENEKNPEGKFVRMFADLEDTVKQQEALEVRINFLNGVVVCTNCKSNNPVDGAFCAICGTRLPHTLAPVNDGTRRCVKCGSVLKPGQVFCGSCGTKAEEPAQAAAPQETPQPTPQPVVPPVAPTPVPQPEPVAEPVVEPVQAAATQESTDNEPRCPHCSALIPADDAVFCAECGTKIR